MDVTPNPLTSEGLILGASAQADGLNVHHRLAALEALYPITGNVFADLGCGRGAYSLALAARHPSHMLLADIEAKNIDAARLLMANTSPEKQYHVAPLEQLELAENSVDCVFMIEVLDHVQDVARCFAQAYRFLRPGGRLYIAVPNSLFPLETHPVKFRGKLYPPQYFPFLPWVRGLHRRMATARIFSAGEIRALAHDVGFSDLKLKYIMPPLERRGPHWLRVLLRRLEQTPFACFGVSTCAVMVKP